MDIDDEAHPKIRNATSKWKCGLAVLLQMLLAFPFPFLVRGAILRVLLKRPALFPAQELNQLRVGQLAVRVDAAPAQSLQRPFAVELPVYFPVVDNVSRFADILGALGHPLRNLLHFLERQFSLLAVPGRHALQITNGVVDRGEMPGNGLLDKFEIALGAILLLAVAHCGTVQCAADAVGGNKAGITAQHALVQFAALVFRG